MISAARLPARRGEAPEGRGTGGDRRPHGATEQHQGRDSQLAPAEGGAAGELEGGEAGDAGVPGAEQGVSDDATSGLLAIAPLQYSIPPSIQRPRHGFPFCIQSHVYCSSSEESVFEMHA